MVHCISFYKRWKHQFVSVGVSDLFFQPEVDEKVEHPEFEIGGNQVCFWLGFVGDGIEYEKPTQSGSGYKVVEGSKNASVVISRKKTQKHS